MRKALSIATTAAGTGALLALTAPLSPAAPASGPPSTGSAGPATRAGPAAAPGITVTSPGADSSFRAYGSTSLTWTNTTGQDVDVWLTVRSGGRAERLAKVTSKAGSERAGEALVTLPRVAPGSSYALEVAAADGAARGFSRPVTVTA